MAAGLRFAASPLPQLEFDVRGGSIGVMHAVGANIIALPLAGLFDTSPTVRIGVAYQYLPRLVGFGSDRQGAIVVAAVGFETRFAAAPIALGMDIGLQISSFAPAVPWLGYLFWLTGSIHLDWTFH